MFHWSEGFHLICLFVGCPDFSFLVGEWTKKSMPRESGSVKNKNGTTKKLQKCTLVGLNTWLIRFQKVDILYLKFEFWINNLLGINYRDFSEKLLIYNVKEGWAPLCKFLEVPIPKEPMPRSNDKGQFVKRINERNRSQLTRCLLWYGGLIVGSIYLWKNGRLIIRSINTVIYAWIYKNIY